MSTVSTTQSTAASVLANINTREKQADATASEDMNARFLTLLTTQLKNQDPLNPMENAEVTSQLAQMSTVDGIERLNKMFQSFVDNQSASDSMQAAALVGRGVLVEGRKLSLTESGAIGGFDRVHQQHGPRHRPDAARHRGDGPGNLARLGKGDIAHQPALFLARFGRKAVDADVDHGRAGLDPVRLDHFRAAHGGEVEAPAAPLVEQIIE